MSTSTRVPVRIADPAQFVAAIPYFLGYHPADAIVAAAFRGPILGALAHISRPTDADGASAATQHIIEMTLRAHADRLLILSYGPDTSARDLETTLVLAQMSAAVSGAELVGCLHVDGGRFWELSEQNPATDLGHLVAESSCPAVTELIAATGANPAPCRASLTGWFAPGVRAGEVADALATPAPDRSAALLAWARVLDLNTPLSEVSAQDIADAARGILARNVRDTLIALLCPGVIPPDMLDPVLVVEVAAHIPELSVPADERPDAVSGPEALAKRLTQVCACLPDHPAAAPTLTLTAMIWWELGDGAQANEAIDRTLRIDPDVTLARLIQIALRRGIRFGTWPDNAIA